MAAFLAAPIDAQPLPGAADAATVAYSTSPDIVAIVPMRADAPIH
jgi:hypothetical protein